MRYVRSFLKNFPLPLACLHVEVHAFAGWSRPVGSPGTFCGCCAAVPGSTTRTTAAPRIATGTTRTTVTTTSVFGCVCRLTSCFALCVPVCPARTAGNVRRPRFAGRGGVGAMARVSPVRTASAVGQRLKPGRPRAARPRAPYPFGSAPACLSQPPSSRPISATFSLTCWYWPSLSQRQ